MSISQGVFVRKYPGLSGGLGFLRWRCLQWPELLGVILPTDGVEIAASKAMPDKIPHRYWNAAGALYGFLFVELTKLGVDVIGESQLVGYPSQYPSVSMIDYNNGKPNARYWVLKLIKDNFNSGDKLVDRKSSDGPSEVIVQGFITPQGKKVLLVNRANSKKTVELGADILGADSLTVDEEMGDAEPRAGKGAGAAIEDGALRGYCADDQVARSLRFSCT